MGKQGMQAQDSEQHLQILLQAAGMHALLPSLIIQILPEEHIGLQGVVDNPGLLGHIRKAPAHTY